MLGFFEVYQEVVVGKYIFGEKVKNIQMYWKKKKLAAAADLASPSHLPHFLFKKRRSNYDVWISLWISAHVGLITSSAL